ncbi:ABC transporter substrate-binding protein [Paenibacillus thailandensis]|uniref:ABC transporter substrate-binding protein n=1 Tax=Paenibacillus thailandensis TaxID=393250 RepID=A0ABW5QXB4_9BACL
MKALLKFFVFAALAVLLAACGSNGGVSSVSGSAENASASPEASPVASPAESQTPEAAGTKTITYLDQEYEVPASTERIVIAGAIEAMEDAIVLDVHPAGAISVGGVFPDMFASITDQAKPIGEKMEPDFEAILALKPDVILGSSKFKPEVTEQLQKIATVIPYSHIATNWEANLRLLAELSGKTEEAEQEIAQYKADLESAKAKLGEELKDKRIVAVRVRQGDVYVYPVGVFFNPVLYGDLGLAPPAEVAAAKAQEAISIEKLAEMNPDVMFIQFSPDENTEAPKALEELQSNPILSGTNAFKNGQAYVNVVDPLAQGGTAYSKIEFLKAFVEKLGE